MILGNPCCKHTLSHWIPEGDFKDTGLDEAAAGGLSFKYLKLFYTRKIELGWKVQVASNLKSRRKFAISKQVNSVSEDTRWTVRQKLNSFATN